MTRPAFCLVTDERTPALLMPRGHDLATQRFDVGTQVLFTPDDEDAPSAKATVAAAIEASGLAQRLTAGTSLTLVVSDPALPSPAMRDDVRRELAEQVLALAASHGLDDVAVLVANGLSRRPGDRELERLLGERVVRSFRAVDGLATFDAEAEDLVEVADVDGVEVRIHPRLVSCDLVVDLRVLAERPDPVEEAAGAWADVVLGLSSARTVAALRGRDAEPALAARVAAAVASRIEMVSLVAVLGQLVHGAPLDLVSRRPWEWGARQRLLLAAAQRALKAMPEAAARSLYGDLEVHYPVLSVEAGEPASAHDAALSTLFATRSVAPVKPADVLAMGVPHPLPVAPASVTNPVAAAWHVLARGGLARDPRVLADGGTIVGFHPLTPRFSARHHAASADFFATVASDDLDAVAAAEERLVRDSWLLDLYRHHHAFHPLQPFHLWYACQPALRRAGQVVWVGARRDDAVRLGGRAATRWSDALELCRDRVGAEPLVTVVPGNGSLVVGEA